MNNLTNERKDVLLAHAYNSLAKWNAREDRYKSPSDAPPANLLGCEEVIALLTELNTLTGHTPATCQVQYNGQTFRLTEADVTLLVQQHEAKQVNEYFTEADVAARFDEPLGQPLTLIHFEQPVVTVKPEALSDRYEVLCKQYVDETDPVKKAAIKVQMERVKRAEIQAMLNKTDELTKDNTVRTHQPFGAHNRHANY